MLALALFLCAGAAVTDGDTLRCQDGTRVRIAGIDAPEMGPCPRNRTCVSGNPHASKRHLARLVAGQTLRCRRVGVTYGRISAWCTNGAGVDLSCAMVQAGMAVRWARYWKGHRC